MLPRRARSVRSPGVNAAGYADCSPSPLRRGAGPGASAPCPSTYHDLRWPSSSKGPVVHRPQPGRPAAPHLARPPTLLRDAFTGVLQSMSFTAEVKDELSRVPATCTSLRQGHAGGARAHRGHAVRQRPESRYRVEVATDVRNGRTSRHQAPCTSIYRAEDRTSRCAEACCTKRRTTSSRCPPQPQLAAALARHGRAFRREAAWSWAYPNSWLPSDCCAAAYLRGAFLGSGFISNPRGDFHFEITVEVGKPGRRAWWSCMERARGSTRASCSGAARTWCT